MISNVDDVIKWLELTGCKYFVVQLKDGDNSRVFEADESRSFEDNIAVFRRIMDVSRANRYIIKASESKISKRGNYLEEFKNTSETLPSIQGTQQPTVQGYSKEDVQAEITKALKDYKTEQELEALRAENRELSKEVNRRQTVGEQFLERALPYVGQIMPALIGKFIPQAGHVALQGIVKEDVQDEAETTDIETELTDDEADRVEAAVLKWAAADPDFLQYIEGFADFAASGKKVMGMDYTQVKAMFGPAQLKSMLQ